MIWTKAKARKVKNLKVCARLLEELDKNGRSPVSGSLEYWTRIVENTSVDHRTHPELYTIGKGQQGVLSVEPYKSEILPFWSFKDQYAALVSADTIYQLFLEYLQHRDFVGADMAKKYLHMGFTRSRRYANHRSGLKYGGSGKILPQEKNSLISEKAFCADIFKMFWDEARQHSTYLRLKKAFKDKHKPAKSAVKS